MAASISVPSSASASGTGLATRIPLGSPSAWCAAITAASSSADSTRWSTGSPLDRLKKAGNSSVPTPITGTPRVSSTSRVRGRSRIDFAPAETTVTGVRASSSRSAEMSNVVSAPRWTPPMPPVAKIRMPARCARNIVAATVVPALRPAATSAPRSRRDALATPSPAASFSSSSAPSPTRGRPSTTAMVAGTAPEARTTSSTPSAVSRLRGYGIPWVTIVDSRATTARPASSAAATSSATVTVAAPPEAGAEDTTPSSRPRRRGEVGPDRPVHGDRQTGQPDATAHAVRQAGTLDDRRDRTGDEGVAPTGHVDDGDGFARHLDDTVGVQGQSAAGAPGDHDVAGAGRAELGGEFGVGGVGGQGRPPRGDPRAGLVLGAEQDVDPGEVGGQPHDLRSGHGDDHQARAVIATCPGQRVREHLGRRVAVEHHPALARPGPVDVRLGQAVEDAHDGDAEHELAVRSEDRQVLGRRLARDRADAAGVDAGGAHAAHQRRADRVIADHRHQGRPIPEPSEVLGDVARDPAR